MLSEGRLQDRSARQKAPRYAIRDRADQAFTLTPRGKLPLAPIATKACARAWNRDRYGNVIGAKALPTGTRLISKDEAMQAHCQLTLL